MSNTPIRHMIGHEDALADEFETILGLRTILDGVVRGGASAINVTPTGTLLVDFTVQPITATAVTYGGPGSGATVINDGAFGSYSVTRNIINHDTSLFAGVGTNTITLTADGWSMSNSGSNAPTAEKDFRPAVQFSTPLDFTGVESLTFEWGFPQKAVDFSQGLYVGLKPRILQGSAYYYSTYSMMTNQVIQKSQKMTTVVPFDDVGYAAAGWSLSGTPNAAAITELQPRINVVYNANGGTEVVLRRIWANRKQAKALACFCFDDGLKDHINTVAPMLQAAGGKGSAAIISNVMASPGVNDMSAANVRSLYNDYGWSIHNHMVTSSQTLEAAINYSTYTAGSPNRVTFTCNTSITTAMVDVATTPTVEIRNTWGPEYAGTHNVLSIGSGTFDIEVTGPTQVTSSSQTQPKYRMDWPGETRTQRVTNQVEPCTAALEAELGANWRGRTVFVVPQGDYDPAVIPELQAAGFTGARGTGAYYSGIGSQTADSPLKTTTTTVSGTQYSVGWFDKWALCVVGLDSVAYSNIAKYTALIDEAVAKGYYICFLSHFVKSGVSPVGLTTSQEVLQDLVTLCGSYKTAGQLEFVTLDEIVAAT